MTLNDLAYFKKELTEFFFYESYDINDLKNIKEIIHRLEGYLLMADKKKFFEYFDSFYELTILNILNDFLDKGNQQISFYILECIYILLTNIQNTGFIFYLYSTKYKTLIPGESLNIIDKIISIDAQKKEEFLTYQVNFIKSLTLKLNKDCIEFFFNKYKNQFPILNKAFSLYNHKDAMIRSVVKNIYLSILKIDDKDLRKFMTAFPNNIYFPNIIFQLRNIIMKLCLINFLEDNSKSNPIDKFRDEHDILVDHMFYISDLLLIGLDNVNFILINCILNEIILPLLKVIISKKEEKVSIVFALYILILFIYIVKNKFINDVISYLLFEENISKNLLDKIKEFEFKLINENIMKNVNSIIIHNQFADVNDIEWKTISRYMQEVTGTDLSAGFIINDNIYNLIKNIIYNKNNNNLVENEIFSNIKMLFTARDDCILLILNLLIHSEISFYSHKNNEDNSNIENINNEKKNVINNDKNNDIINLNNINNEKDNDNQNIINFFNINNEKDNNINNINNNNKDNKDKKDENKNLNNINNMNNINDDIIEKIKDELFDDEDDIDNKNNKSNNILNNNINKKETIDNKIDNNDNNQEINNQYKLFQKSFFNINLSNNDNLFNLLLKSIQSPKNFRIITNEIILSNISFLINISLYKEDDKKKITQKIIEIFKGEIQKLRKLLTQEENLKKLAFSNLFKAYEHYVSPIDKKVKDLITTAFILIPLIYLDYEPDIPIYLKEDKFNYQLIKVYILNIIILYDIINDLLGFQNNMILKTKKFPLEVPTNQFVLGKEYSEKDFGEEKNICEIIINNKIFKGIIFCDFEYIYFGNILSNSFKNLSKIKIIKKFPLRSIFIKIPKSNEEYEEENTLLDIYSEEEGENVKNKKFIEINCFEADKTARIYNFLKEQKNNAIQLEYSLFDSYIDAIERKITVI